eukprot:TRINITY_DN4617_c0_g1_i4.p1 TRINITY_DN4617_c0_g1~~TRINITY_DN4617_c0_g1_i4.p1  ORF type:complete len:184 (-),score=19.90 TRINITY_DN4617_c0_g1_i4:55-579(-)
MYLPIGDPDEKSTIFQITKDASGNAKAKPIFGFVRPQYYSDSSTTEVFSSYFEVPCNLQLLIQFLVVDKLAFFIFFADIQLLPWRRQKLEITEERKGILFSSLAAIWDSYSYRSFGRSSSHKLSLQFNNSGYFLSLIHISEPTRPLYISYAVFCLKKKKKKSKQIRSTNTYTIT